MAPVLCRNVWHEKFPQEITLFKIQNYVENLSYFVNESYWYERTARGMY